MFINSSPVIHLYFVCLYKESWVEGCLHFACKQALYASLNCPCFLFKMRKKRQQQRKRERKNIRNKIRCWCEQEHKFSSRRHHHVLGGEMKFYIEKLPQWLVAITLFHKSLFLRGEIHLPHDVHFVFINISAHFPSLLLVNISLRCVGLLLLHAAITSDLQFYSLTCTLDDNRTFSCTCVIRLTHPTLQRAYFCQLIVPLPLATKIVFNCWRRFNWILSLIFLIAISMRTETSSKEWKLLHFSPIQWGRFTIDWFYE